MTSIVYYSFLGAYSEVFCNNGSIYISVKNTRYDKNSYDATTLHKLTIWSAPQSWGLGICGNSQGVY